jgi:hypothetical protein
MQIYDEVIDEIDEHMDEALQLEMELFERLQILHIQI